MERPEEPDPSDCCGSGCCPCVWDTYYDRLAAFEAHVAAGGAVLEGPHTPETATAADIDPRPHPPSYSVIWRYAASQGDSDDAVVDADPMDEATLAGFLRKAGFRGPVVPKLVEGDPAGSALVRWTLPHADEGADHTRQDFATDDSLPPGAAVDVFVPAATDTAAELSDRLGVSRRTLMDGSSAAARIELLSSPFAAPGSFPPWLPRAAPLRCSSLFSHFVDTGSAAWATPPFVALLAQHAESAAEQEKLRELSGLPWPEFKRRLLGSFPSLLGLLREYPSVKLPLPRLLEHAPPLRARAFSVAGVSPAGVDICVRPVRATRPNGPDFTGHVTRALQEGQAVWWRPRRTVHAFPSAVAGGTAASVALIAGSGVAPFMRLLQRRAQLIAAGGALAPLTLCWATRDERDAQLLPASMISAAKCDVRLALTRQPQPVDGALQSAAELLEASARELWNAWRPGGGGTVLLCGPPGFVETSQKSLPDLLAHGSQGVAEQQLRGLSTAEFAEALVENKARFWSEHWAEGGRDGALLPPEGLHHR